MSEETATGKTLELEPAPNTSNSDSDPQLAPTCSCNIVPYESEVLDHTHEFMTDEVFKSKEELLEWIRVSGKSIGVVIVIKYSEAGRGCRKSRIVFACERYGNYKRKKLSEEEQTNKKRRANTGTKKCGCPFQLVARKVNNVNDDWVVRVSCGVHNHPPYEHVEGHSYAGRLNKEESDLVAEMVKSHVPPKDILKILKNKDPTNATTIKGIYNAYHKEKVLDKGGKSEIQHLLSKLTDYKYAEWHRSDPETDMVMDLLFAHPSNIDLLRAFPRVLLMDCSYKTNKYRLPLFEIVGVTSTDMTFSVAFVYLGHEREDNFVWALERLRGLLVESEYPSVIVTDSELALMNAIVKVFPSATSILCRWHIGRNILINCRKDFDTQNKWNRFLLWWDLLVTTKTEEDYEKRLSDLQKELVMHPKTWEYVTQNWLLPYKEKFVAAWVDKSIHFGNVTINHVESSHVESSHSKLKKYLGTSQGSFVASWEKIHGFFESIHAEVKASFGKSRTVEQHKFMSELFKDIRRFVSVKAMEHIATQSECSSFGPVNKESCDCELRRTHGLPCAHEISMYRLQGRSIPLNSIDPHWRKLDIIRCHFDAIKKDDLAAEMEMLSKYIEKCDENELRILKYKIRELVRPDRKPFIESSTLNQTCR